jgi:hypothetical protein
MFAQLNGGALARTHQREERGGVLPLQTLLHVLRGDDRVVVVRDDAARDAAHLKQTPRAPPAEHDQRRDKQHVTGNQLCA